MNATEINDEIRKWLAEHEPRTLDLFNEVMDSGCREERLLRLAFKAGVDYGQSKATVLPAMLGE